MRKSNLARTRRSNMKSDCNSPNLISNLLNLITSYFCVIFAVSVSIAKAPLSLINPSIITSISYRTYFHPYLWILCLSFNNTEPRLTSFKDSRGIQTLPERVPTTFLLFNFLKRNKESIPNKNLLTLNHLDSKNTNYRRHVINNKASSNLLFHEQIKNVNSSGQTRNSKWRRILLILSGDVEVNPGPEMTEMTLVTLNCRGLKKENKLRQIINRVRKEHKSNCLIVALQETHIDQDNLKYMWKGKYTFTSSLGAKGGLITLLSDNVIILEQIDKDNEIQIILIEFLVNNESKKFVIVNLHSPCAHNSAKTNYFDFISLSVNDIIDKNPEAKIVILGDFNTTFHNLERNGTTRSRGEDLIANRIMTTFKNMDMIDCWNPHNIHPDYATMTWRHGGKMSKLDRILWSNTVDLTWQSTTTDWTYAQSDHCAVIVKLKGQAKKFDKIVRIDTFFLNNVLLKHKFLVELGTKMDQLSDTNMNPHQSLEYLKMSIRSTAIEISTNFKKENEKRLSDLRNEINFWQKTFENTKDKIFRDLAAEKLDDVICKRDKMLDEKGRHIADRMQSKWYQEGEKGTKYFLNLQRSKGKRTEMNKILIEGKHVTNSDEIDQHVSNFYKVLYEKGDSQIKNKKLVNDFLANMTKLSESERVNINRLLSLEELYSTLKTCKDSSPGPDGIPYSIIKLTWKYFGPILINSWSYALSTGNLTHSHESSYLKLLPKEGKDPLLIKNWRPITLSNCDFKIITKTLATRLTEGLASSISPNQTAYIKGRQITDNLHILQYAIEKSTLLNKEALIASLDAEKAFDSIEHWYIKSILKKIGLPEFIPIFELLYKNQSVTIHLNNHNAGSYNIKNGVKQGDALSCIIFILGMEPLLKNINADPNIKGLNIDGFDLPKAISYADDVACILHPDESNLQKIFHHYQRMSELSGLNLNADKTEIIENIEHTRTYAIHYGKKLSTIKTSSIIKINGLNLGFDLQTAKNLNFEKMYTSMEKQFRLWSCRGLTLLGKIVIYKTYGLSQILFICATVKLTKAEESKLTNLIYKFLWNRDMDRNKAPDRIKRTILHSKIENLGFGMIDFRDVVKSIRVKTILRLLNSSNSPLGNIIKTNVSSSTIKISNLKPIRECIDESITALRLIWKQQMSSCPENNLNVLSNIIGNEYVGNLILPRYRNKRICLLHRHDQIKDISPGNRGLFQKMDRFVGEIILKKFPSCTNDFNPDERFKQLLIHGKVRDISKVTSRTIRDLIEQKPRISIKKIVDPNPHTLKKLGNIIKKLTNVRLKTTLLRVLHGDVYCGSRMLKFGMTDSDSCPRCGKCETLEHQLLECDYVKKIWAIASKITSIPVESLSTLLGHNEMHDRTTITIHGEIIRRLLAIERPLTDPLKFMSSVTSRLSSLEKGITQYQINLMKNIIDGFT